MRNRVINITYKISDSFLCDETDTKQEIIERAQRIAWENAATLNFVYDETNNEILFK